MSQVGMAQLQEPEGPCLLCWPLGGMDQGIHRAGPEDMLAGLPSPALLGNSLKVTLGPLVHLRFQVKFWLKLACC